jgi:hypothetical protein
VLDTRDPRLARLRERLAPYARGLLDRAGGHALRLHADVVSLEHLLSVLMLDAECGAHAAVLHAFADPQTICEEALAISPGVMVVASGSILPFSPLALRALVRARELALARGGAEVDERDLLAGASEALSGEARAALAAAGYRDEALARAASAAAGAGPIASAGPLFRHFSMQAKRALSAANRDAAAASLETIGPAHVVIGCLRSDERLAELAGLGWQRARLALSAHAADRTPPAPRLLPADELLVVFLERLPERAGSVALLAGILAGGPVELSQILRRHKVTAELLARAGAAFADPDPAP